MDRLTTGSTHPCSAVVRLLRQFRWKPLVSTAGGCACIYAPIVAVDSSNGALLYWLVFLLLLFCSLAVASIFVFTGKGGMRSHWSASALFAQSQADICSSTSTHYAPLIAGPFTRCSIKNSFSLNMRLPPMGLEWDGWGFAGSDTKVYLVHDPEDRIRHMRRTKNGVRVEGLPCEIWKVRRLEKQWYSVVFFTNENWSTYG